MLPPTLPAVLFRMADEEAARARERPARRGRKLSADRRGVPATGLRAVLSRRRNRAQATRALRLN